ncbi:MAG TPA: hypothetical protein VGD37_43275 [Kofleriaceae bacterium]
MGNIANTAEAGGRLPDLVERAAGGPATISAGAAGRLRRSWRRGPVLTSVLAAAAVACAPAAPQRFPAKPPDCALETLKILPQRPYIELETFNLHSPESMRDVLDIVQERACRDGADAIYAPKGGRAYSYAIALKWSAAPAPAAAPPPAP